MDAACEKYLWDEMNKGGHGKPFPRYVIRQMVNDGMIKSHKQAWRTLEKWTQKRIYDYGSCLDLGWKVEDMHLFLTPMTKGKNDGK